MYFIFNVRRKSQSLMYRVRQIPLFWKMLKKTTEYFLKFFFYLKVQSFLFQMAVSAGHAVAYTIGPIFEISEMFNCWERRLIDVKRFTHAFRHKGCQFLSLFLPDNRHTELTASFLPKSLHYYHDFQCNVAIFPSIVQAYTQPYSFGGKIKLIICQIRHELSVTIHKIGIHTHIHT